MTVDSIFTREMYTNAVAWGHLKAEIFICLLEAGGMKTRVRLIGVHGPRKLFWSFMFKYVHRQ